MPGWKLMQILKPGLLYFVLVFSVGFVLGTVRTLWIAPQIGARAAELLETPVMLAVSFAAARWVARRLAVPHTMSRRLGMGMIALVLLLLTEFTLVLWLRGLSISQYLATRDPVSGTVYYVALAIFAVMPAMVERR